MNEKFFDLKKDKQDRIINGALKIFALNGYKKASTDEVVKEAGISKGLLFHYFGNKQGLYAFIYEYSARYISLELTRVVAGTKQDFFGFFKQIEEAKLQVMKRYPYLQMFLDAIEYEDKEEALIEIRARSSILIEIYKRVKDKMDTSALKPETDVDKLVSMIQIIVVELTRKQFQQNGSKNPDLLYLEICGYLDLLQLNFYKEVKEREFL